jgi:GntR family transcriptional regulator/MocR family aminotransferase
VIYCGTFAKSLFPSLRLGYLALPPDLMPAAAACKWLTDRGNPSLLQQMVGELMATGEYDRHIRRMQRRYRTRRNILVNAIETHLRGVAEIEGSEAGLHIVVWLPHLDAARTDDLLAACQARDVGVYSVGRYATLPLRRAGLLLGYGLIDDGVIEEGVARLAAAYGEIAGVADPAIASRPPRSLDTPTARSSRRPQGRVSRQPA